MKRFITLMLAMVMALSLAACGSKDTASVDAAGLAKALAEKVQFDSGMTALSADDASFYLAEDLPDGLPEGSTISAYMSAGNTLEEIFVVSCKTKTDADAVKVAIQTLLDSQMKQAETYQPDEVTRLNGAIFGTYGTCVVLCVTSDTDTANAVIKEYVG